MGFWLLVYSVLLFAAETRPLLNDYSRKTGEPETFDVSVIDQETADRLFSNFLAHKEIPYRYPLGGCSHRSNAMAKIAESQHIKMGKVIVEGRLQVATNLSLYPTARWGWHIAPVVYVKGKDGKVKLMVFDPSLFKQPMTVDDWTFPMTYQTADYEAKIDSIYFGSRYQFAPRGEQGTRTAWSPEQNKYDAERMKRFSVFQDRLAPSTPSRNSGLAESENTRTAPVAPGQR